MAGVVKMAHLQGLIYQTHKTVYGLVLRALCVEAEASHNWFQLYKYVFQGDTSFNIVMSNKALKSDLTSQASKRDMTKTNRKPP